MDASFADSQVIGGGIVRRVSRGYPYLREVFLAAVEQDHRFRTPLDPLLLEGRVASHTSSHPISLSMDSLTVSRTSISTTLRCPGSARGIRHQFQGVRDPRTSTALDPARAVVSPVEAEVVIGGKHQFSLMHFTSQMSQEPPLEVLSTV